MSLLREIQAAAIDSGVDVTVLLRKCKVLAARLSYTSFKQWLGFELDGYPDAESLPPYRKLIVQSQGDFSGAYRSGLKNAPIPPSCLPEAFREGISTAYFMEPISYLASVVRDVTSENNALRMPWPPDLTALVAHQIYQNMNCLSAWRTIPKSALVSIVDSVRNKILDFVLEIEAEAPDIGETGLEDSPITESRVNQVFNTFISGSGQVVAGDSTVGQQTFMSINAGDFSGLRKYLESIGLQATDLDELDAAISDDKDNNPEERFGSNVSNWLGGIIKKVSDGALNVSPAVAANLITKALESYFGM